MRTQEETDLLNATSRRSTESTDLNIYYVRRFTVAEVNPPPFGNAAEAVTGDCFAGVADAAHSGVIVDASALLQKPVDGVALLIHEIGHALLDRPSWGVDEHNDQLNVPYSGSNVMSGTVSRGTVNFDANQCGNIELDLTLFRGDP